MQSWLRDSNSDFHALWSPEWTDIEMGRSITWIPHRSTQRTWAHLRCRPFIDCNFDQEITFCFQSASSSSSSSSAGFFHRGKKPAAEPLRRNAVETETAAVCDLTWSVVDLTWHLNPDTEVGVLPLGPSGLTDSWVLILRSSFPPAKVLKTSANFFTQL